MKMLPVVIAYFFAVVSSSQAQQSPILSRGEAGNPYKPVVEAPGLPRVLIIGDSISEGYTLQVRKLLEGKANVLRIPQNGGPARLAGPLLDGWLGTKKWDVIHFNWGLHDLMFFPSKTMDPAQHEKEQIELYEKNLRILVARLKQTGAKLIWASSTPVPDQMSSPRSPSNRSAVVKQYNEVAARVMKESDVPVDDLFALCTPLSPNLQRPNDVHFNLDGYDFLARKVAKEIIKTLEIGSPSRR